MITFLVAAAACTSAEPSDSGSATDTTDDATTAPDDTTLDPDSEGPGPGSNPTTATTMSTVSTDPDVTGDPSGPEDTSTVTESSTGEPVDPPTEPEIMYERPPGAFFENLARTADGTILMTDHTGKQIVAMTPQGEVEVFADLDAWPLSITIDTDGTVVIVAHDRVMFGLAQELVTGNEIWIADGIGGADLLTAVAGATFLNGSCLLEPGVVLVPDSNADMIWRIDVATGDAEPWVQHMLLTRDGTQNVPGANGCKLRDGTLYVSNSDRGTIVEIPVGGDGSAGVPSVYFAGPLVDDFTIAASGTIYATSHGADVFLIRPDLSIENVAGMAEGVIGNTSVVFGGTAFDDETIYVATDGGLYVAGGNAGASGPARIVRVPVGESE